MLPSRILSQITRQNLQFTSGYSVQTVKLPKQHEWNRAIASAERLVGFPTSAYHLKTLFSEDANVTEHVRKLMGSDHPVLKSFKRLIIQGGQNNVQVRGLMMLLMAKSLNLKSPQALNSDELDESTGVLIQQRKLAEIVEMISAAFSIHKSVMNLPYELPDPTDKEAKEDLLQLEYGNKIAILGGDYLLANACVGLAALRNTYIVEMISIAIGEFTQSEFHGKRDVQGRLIPDEDSISINAWTSRNKLASGSLLASGFKGIGMLIDLPDDLTEKTEKIGRHLALALQAFIELQPFLDETNFDNELSLACAPILFHLQKDQTLLQYVQNCDNDVDNLDMKMILSTVVQDGYGLEATKNLCQLHAKEVLKEMSSVPDCEAKNALLRIVKYLLH